MDALINVTELTCELAHRELVSTWVDPIYSWKRPESEWDTKGMYTERGQDKFNELVDYYEDFVMACEIK